MDNASGMLIERGKALHRQGRFNEAASLYQQVLAADRENADALHLLGVIANQQGDHERAASLIGKAVQRNPEAAFFHCNLGLALMGMGDWEGARAQFLAELEKFPSSHAGHANLGVLLQKQGKQEQAIVHYRAALALQPDDVMVLNNLGFAHMELREFDAARDLAGRSMQIQAENPDALNLLGLLSRHQARFEEAVNYFAQAIRLKPTAAEIFLNMGVAYRELGAYEKSITCFERTLELGGAAAQVYNNLGLACSRLGEHDKALAWYDRALQADPEYPDAHFSRSLLMLLQGQYETGWKEYEYGLLCGERQPGFQGLPRWRGEPLSGKTLLVSAEQGLGDEIMFASVLPEIIEQAGHCIVECDAKLVPIYERSFPSATVINRRKPGEVDSAECLPHVDLQSPGGSLPLYRRNRLEDFPQHAGYLKADPERVAYWKTRLDELGPGLKVGISWRGGTLKTGVDRRSIPLADWLPVFKQEGIQFVSLQYTECSAEVAELEQAHGVRLTHWPEAIDDYAETAALVCALDLVITVQTAIFHLGGALGRPVWGLIPIPAEWRYMLEGESLPWYPSARLLRQSSAGNWGEVMGAVAADLGGYAAVVPREESGLA
jgi:tetratricopeptide (TPR) repeat protein